ncbi:MULTISPECIES: flagellar basal-body MS-ring/collar protein FliF [unclassified Sphingomonas]|uniref:flagellar basal-body MS-ring/collar protein FliF n=1 Tax=unclassified Sphingomonas TaxID=196159 RepID=UPI0006FFEECF|nr:MULTISPECIES: flagellar basal-body MS-ring/collar protein FliF [unclassified Sphingomonas]KQX26132.1 flagellar M-ring protein FliF [Sphingomonas sp. Root1294]KQY69199.1 flagellar M-ring protein FliF [Sphingomonas sp. Root50]KRB89454.1 flagellar M-ring protein FliF [Sphingomonas sp. Root720]
MADIIPSPATAPATALSASGPASGVGTGAVLERIKDFTAQPAVQRSLPMIGMLGLLGGAALLWSTMSGAPQRDLFAGMGDADKAAVADSLKAAGIPYEIDRSTGSLTVAETSFYQAKMLLAQQGLPKSAPDGDTMISSLPLGASRAVEGEKLRTAREMDLARTIEAIDSVDTAKVHVAAEQPSVFLRDEAKPQASVMLRLRAGRTLSDSQVQAIVHLVASSVPNLSPDGVSVVDQAGRLLSSSGGDPMSQASTRQVDIQNKIEQRYLEALNKILTPIVGPGNFTAEVHADVDFTETQATRESYPKDTAVVRQEQGSWTGDKKNGEASGIPGALSNQPPAASQVAAAPNQTVDAPAAGTTDAANANKTSENYNRTYELGREVSVTRAPVGSVKRLSVAVALREGSRKFSRAELASIETLVRGAIGADQARGDVVALSARSFAVAEEAEVKPNWWEAPWVSTLARNLSALLVVALLVFGVAKPLLKRRAAYVEEKKAALDAMVASGGRLPQGTNPAIRAEIASEMAQQALIDPNKPVTLDMIEATPGYANRAELIRNFVKQDPDRAALVVRDLIRADMPGA